MFLNKAVYLDIGKVNWTGAVPKFHRGAVLHEWYPTGTPSPGWSLLRCCRPELSFNCFTEKNVRSLLDKILMWSWKTDYPLYNWAGSGQVSLWHLRSGVPTRECLLIPREPMIDPKNTLCLTYWKTCHGMSKILYPDC